MSVPRRAEMVQNALVGHLPPGWRHLSADSLAAVLARPIEQALEAAATAGHYTQDHHEGFYSGVRALRSG